LDSSPIGVVVGLRAEARLARRLGFRVAVGGGTRAGAEAAARLLVAEGAQALVSFGLSGGLQPPLRCGKILVPGEIRFETGERLPTDPALSQLLGGTTEHAILGGDRVVGEPQAKRLLWKLTGAAAVDLESGAIARVAAEYGLPCAALRVICDPAGRRLPSAALAGLDQKGKITVRPVLRALAARPWQIGNLLRLAADAFIARRALTRHLRALRRGRSAGEADQPAGRAS
jgi:adenosylhomocysteine nucleosidase